MQESFSRVLQPEAPTAVYRRRNMEIKTTVQWQERKLFLYELEFLTQYGLRDGTVAVYAGVAPATRIPFLASLFPHIRFVLACDFEKHEHFYEDCCESESSAGLGLMLYSCARRMPS